MTQQQQNLSLVKKLYEDVFNKGLLDTIHQFFATDVKYCHTATPSYRGVNTVKEKEQVYRNAFPNKHATVNNVWAFDDKVVCCWTTQATHKGEFKGIAPTNKNVTVCGITVYQFANGKISCVHQNWDRFSLFEQLGVFQNLKALIHH